MYTSISVALCPSERKCLLALVNNRNAAQKHVWRAEIVLLSAEVARPHEVIQFAYKTNGAFT